LKILRVFLLENHKLADVLVIAGRVKENDRFLYSVLLAIELYCLIKEGVQKE
jgi:hypothetical protein